MKDLPEMLQEFKEKFSYQGNGIWFQEGIKAYDEDENLISSTGQAYATPKVLEDWIIDSLTQAHKQGRIYELKSLKNTYKNFTRKRFRDAFMEIYYRLGTILDANTKIPKRNCGDCGKELPESYEMSLCGSCRLEL